MKLTEKNRLESLKELPDWAKPVEQAYLNNESIEGFLDELMESKETTKKALHESEEGTDMIGDFESKVEAYEDYINNDFYNEKCDTGEKMSKVYNSIDELKYGFGDYEDACKAEGVDSDRVADYCQRMYNVIDALKAFADKGDEE